MASFAPVASAGAHAGRAPGNVTGSYRRCNSLQRSSVCTRLPPGRGSMSPAAVEQMLGQLGELSAIDGGSGGSSTALLALPAIGAAISYAGLRFYAYTQLEFITASMLTNNVPKGGNGARVIQLGGGTRELYYYPKDCLQVTVVGTSVNKGLMEQAGMTAAVPTIARQQPPSDLGFAQPGSVDAVVALNTLGALAEPQRRAALSEAMRVLKPGGRLLFIERVEGGGGLGGLLGGGTGGLSLAELGEYGQMPGWETVMWDLALARLNPHWVGVAVRADAGAEGAAVKGSSRSSAGPQKKRGFKV